MSDSSAQQIDQPTNLEQQTSPAPQAAVTGARPVVARPAGTTLTLHPLARLFPVMTDSANDDFVRDIAANGLREPITTIGDEIVDGANRYRVCRDLGLPFTTEEWDGRGSLLGFVIRKNLYRRQLSESRRALLGEELAKMLAAEGPTSQPSVSDDASVADSPQGAKGRARDRAAAMANVSSGSVGAAQRLCRNGVPELVEMVRQDKVAVSAAADVAGLPTDEQTQIVEGGPDAVRKASKEKREKKKSAAAKGKAAAQKSKATRAKESRQTEEFAAPDTDDDSPEETDTGEDEAFLIELEHETGIMDSPLFAVDAQAARRIHALLDTELDGLRHRLLDRSLSPTQSPVFRELSRVLDILDPSGWRPCPCSRTRSTDASCSICRGRGYVIEPVPATPVGVPVTAEPNEQGVPVVAPAEPTEPPVRRKRRRVDNLIAAPACT